MKRGIFSRMYRRVFPRRALENQVYSDRLKRHDDMRKRSLDAVDGGRSRFEFNTTSQDIDSKVLDNQVPLREQIRQYELENGNVSGPFRRIKKNVVGPAGIKLNVDIAADGKDDRTVPNISESQAELANKQVEKYFPIWNKQADTRLILPFGGSNGIQGVVEHALLRDNEVLVIGRRSTRPGRLIPYCLEVLETDRLQTPPGEVGNTRVENGIRYDKEGAQEAFYILKEHPGNTLNLNTYKDDDYEEVPAYNPNGTKKVMFLFSPIRPEQKRAFSLLTSALKDIQDADRYMEAEKLGALEDSCMFGTVTTENPSGWDEQANVPSGKEGYDRINEFAPNQMHYLYPNEKLNVHRTVRPNSQFSPFIEQIWRGPANSLDVPPEITLQNWAGMNYSNARTVLLQFYSTCRERQQFLIDNLCENVYENVFRWFVIKGLVQAPSFSRRPHDWLKHDWIPPGWQWVDPKKEADGKDVEVNMGTETLSDIMMSKGQDPKMKLERRAKELKYINELEEKYGVDMTSRPDNNGNREEEDRDE